MTENKPNARTGLQSADAPGANHADADRLLEQFFQAARAEQLSDDGFSERVMQLLPERQPSASTVLAAKRQQTLSRLWTAVCVVIALTLFTLVGGWQQIAYAILHVLTTQPTTAQLLQLMVCAAALTTLTAAEVLRRDWTY